MTNDAVSCYGDGPAGCHGLVAKDSTYRAFGLPSAGTPMFLMLIMRANCRRIEYRNRIELFSDYRYRTDLDSRSISISLMVHN